MRHQTARAATTAAACMLAGCRAIAPRTLADDAAEALHRHAAPAFNDAAPLQVIAVIFIAAGGLAIVASYVPVLTEVVPRKAAAAAIIFGLCLQVWAGFNRWIGNGLYWGMLALLVVVGICAAWPYVAALELAIARWRFNLNGRLRTRTR